MCEALTTSSIEFSAYQNVMIMEMPMTPLANVAHLTYVSRCPDIELDGTPKLTA